MFRIDVSVLPDVSERILCTAVCVEVRFPDEISGTESVAKKEAKKEAKKAGTSYP